MRVILTFVINTRTKEMKVHRLVCGVFSDKRRKDLIVNHKNGKKEDNKVENLEYTTQKGNSRHAFDTGLNSNYIAVQQLTMSGEIIAELKSQSAAYRK